MISSRDALLSLQEHLLAQIERLDNSDDLQLEIAKAKRLTLLASQIISVGKNALTASLKQSERRMVVTGSIKKHQRKMESRKNLTSDLNRVFHAIRLRYGSSMSRKAIKRLAIKTVKHSMRPGADGVAP